MAYLATCRCGRLKATCEGEPVRVSVCHCLECQKRTGSAFGVQARWPEAQVHVSGDWKTWERTADSGRKARYRFCPECGAVIAFSYEGHPGLIAIPVGAFSDPGFPPPRFSVYEHRKHAWTTVLGDEVEHSSSQSLERFPPRADT